MKHRVVHRLRPPPTSFLVTHSRRPEPVNNPPPPGAANLGSLRSRLRTPLRYASLRAAPCAPAAQIRVLSHFILDLTSMISYPFPAPRHHSLV